MIDRTQTQGELPPPPPPAAIDAPPGYAIERPLGEGGMGVVVLARQAGLNRPVALKMVRAGMAVDPKALIRFLAEAEAVAAVRHPNVVEVYAYGDHNGRPYLAMEFCPGGSLADRLKAGDRPDPRAAAKLVAAVADGVGAAHALSIVHRDLKPGNVLLTAAGEPKVSDFGLAKRGAGQDLTHTGAVMGTPAYMSPEQAGGGAKFVGPAADVWALGVMLYELLTGTRPFDGGSTDEVLAKVLNGRPAPVRTHLPGVPRDLELIFEKCLEREPADRYPDAAEVAADLRRFLAGQPTKARPVPAAVRATKWAKRNKPLAGALAATVVAMVTGTGVSVAFGIEARREAERADGEAQRADERANELAKALDDSLKTTANLIIHQAQSSWAIDDATNAHYHLDSVDQSKRDIIWNILKREYTGGLLSLAGHKGPHHEVVWSPDGTRLAGCSLDGMTRIWDAATGRRLTDLVGHSMRGIADWSPDGTRIAIGLLDGTTRIWDTGTGRHLTTLKPDGHTGQVQVVGWNSDGNLLATSMSDPRIIRMWHVNSGRCVAGIEVDDHISRIIWHPDGKRLTTISSDRVDLFDAASGRRLTTLARRTEGRIDTVAWSPDGTRLAIGSDDGTTVIVEADSGRCLATLTVQDTNNHIIPQVVTVTWSPDGTRLATGSFDDMARVWDAASGRHLFTLNHGKGRGVHTVVWNPDGTKLATNAGIAGTQFVWDAADGRRLATLVGHTDAVSSIAWSPDGTRLATGSIDGTARVWYTTAGRRFVALESNPGRAFAISWLPDGTRRFVGRRFEGDGIWDGETGRYLATLDGHARSVSAAAWSADGTRLATGSDDNTARVWDAITGRNTATLIGHTLSIIAVAWCPDGKSLATGSYDGTVRVWEIASGRLLNTLTTGIVFSVAWNPEGTRLAIGCRDSAGVWDAASGRCLATLNGITNWDIPEGLPAHARAVAWSPDGMRLATGLSDGTVLVWDAASGRHLTTFVGHTGSILAIAWHPGGTRLVTGSEDATVRVWDAAAGRHQATLTGHSGKVCAVNWSPDGTQLISAGTDEGTVRIWDGRPWKDQPDEAEYRERFYYNRPRPDLHAAARARFEDEGFSAIAPARLEEKNDFAAAVQASLEQRAVAHELFDAGQFQRGSWHLVVAELNRLKSRQHIATPPPLELAPPPRLARDVTTQPR